MKKIILVLILLLTSCVSTGMNDLDKIWEKENKEIFNKIGIREYIGITKEQAIKAMVIAFQRLDIIIENSDFKVGTLTGTAIAPKPISYDEFQTVIAVENARAQSTAGPFFVWTLRGFNSKYNIIYLEIPNGVQISIRANLRYTGRTDMIAIQNFPPKATEIAIKKIWNEFEKIEFIQRATLKKR